VQVEVRALVAATPVSTAHDVGCLVKQIGQEAGCQPDFAKPQANVLRQSADRFKRLSHDKFYFLKPLRPEIARHGRCANDAPVLVVKAHNLVTLPVMPEDGIQVGIAIA